MELQKQCVSLELAKRMKKLGFKQDSLFYWKFKGGDEYELMYCEESQTKEDYPISAYTVAELGEMLPDASYTFRPAARDQYGEWKCGNFIDKWFQQADTEADARAKMLIYLKEQNLI